MQCITRHINFYQISKFVTEPQHSALQREAPIGDTEMTEIAVLLILNIETLGF